MIESFRVYGTGVCRRENGVACVSMDTSHPIFTSGVNYGVDISVLFRLMSSLLALCIVDGSSFMPGWWWSQRSSRTSERCEALDGRPACLKWFASTRRLGEARGQTGCAWLHVMCDVFCAVERYGIGLGKGRNASALLSPYLQCILE